ncbi:MAG: hypothetical protein HY342_08170 [Candidatus Lambdaproteobacteria bacterium]|nr:hypothetical protein [Candidatus Lambdaproteobacteria bacterium]
MSERIVYHPWKVTATAAIQRDGAADHSPVSRPFANILAEAEAVQDSVQLQGPAAPGRWAGLAAGTVQGALALLMRPLHAPLLPGRARHGSSAQARTAGDRA